MEANMSWADGKGLHLGRLFFVPFWNLSLWIPPSFSLTRIFSRATSILKIYQTYFFNISMKARQKMLKKMKNGSKSKKAIVYGDLKSRIVNNLIKPGEPLNEGVLSKELKISKTPIREALQQLEKEGFIENIPVKGAFVSRISIQDIREIFEIREILEGEVVKRAALKADPNKVEALRKKFVSSENDNKRASTGHFKSGDEIHAFIFETFGNDRLKEIYRRLQDHIVRTRIHFFNQSQSSRSEESFEEHLEILDALKAQDPSRAENAVRNHLRNSIEYLRKII